jgi:hypothetical protein
MDKELSIAMQEMPVEKYQDELVMKSTDIQKVVYNLTGKYRELSHFHIKVRKVLRNQLDPILGCAKLLPNGHVEYYRLNRRQAHKVMFHVHEDFADYVLDVFEAYEDKKLVMNYPAEKPSDSLDAIISPDMNGETRLKALELYAQIEIAKAPYSAKAVEIAKIQAEIAKEATETAKAQIEVARQDRLKKKYEKEIVQSDTKESTESKYTKVCEEGYWNKTQWLNYINDSDTYISTAAFNKLLELYKSEIRSIGNCYYCEDVQNILDNLYLEIDKDEGITKISGTNIWFHNKKST